MAKTSLHEKHLTAGAKMAPFGGYDMPLQYGSVKAEVAAVRETVGLFDVSHMGEFWVEGPEAMAFVDYLVTNEFATAGNLKAVYSPLCREDGTVIDDLIAYKLGPETVLICVNASNIEKDWKWIESHKNSFNCKLSNRSDEYSLLAVQGPQTEAVLRKLEVLGDNEFPYYSIQTSNWRGQDIILARTGYTGEDGFEIFSNHETANLLWDQLLKSDVTPCGLAARDVLRLEVGYPLYGHELIDSLTPLDSALSWTVKLDKGRFIGKEALQNYQPKFRLAKLSLDKGIPREGYEVLDEQENVVGVVRSGTMSTTIGRGICLAHIEKSKFPEDKKLSIKIRKNITPATYHTKPFVTGGHK